MTRACNVFSGRVLPPSSDEQLILVAIAFIVLRLPGGSLLNNSYGSRSLLAMGFSLNDLRLLGATLSTYADTAMQILHFELSLCAVFPSDTFCS